MNNKKKIILTIVLLSYFVTAIDSSIVFTGLTKISADLNLNVSTYHGCKMLIFLLLEDSFF
ncbi:hypothetical protein [Clostridium butyricum]|uniref:hypothetical protein n=1 Tax=Clostridium butyricum TaxID=1492 RepID=UPI0015E287B2|nr:hypothetical protein [Clostridium butyricum]